MADVATPAWWYEEPEAPEACRCEVCTWDGADTPEPKCAHRRTVFLERDEDGPVFWCLCCEEVRRG